MAKRKSKIAESLKQLGDIQVNEWDFAGLLNTNIDELAISRSLRRLGQIQVMEWDLRTVIPTAKKTANIDVDVAGYFRRVASYRVMEWDFGNPSETGAAAKSSAEIQAILDRLKNFLQYVATNLINEPSHAQIKVSQISPNVLRLKLLLMKRDVSMLIGKDGLTAKAIRNIVKSAGRIHGMEVLLQIHSHEEETVMLAKERAKTPVR